ncbi:MFS transporter [Nocardia sp. KC 131]|uniref:MFS transporter n=1 Tax=Nocardia arseniciresistens TaxID=3392119 RepID=UPI00398F7AE4
MPEAKVEGMRRAADAWSDSADGLVLVLQGIATSEVKALKAASGGVTADAVRKQLRALADETRRLIDYNNSMAKQLYEGATALELEIYTVCGIAMVLGAQLALDLLLGPPGLSKAVADRTAAEAAMKLAWRELVMRLRQLTLRSAAERPVLAMATRGATIGAATMGGVRAIAEGVQIAHGDRVAVDWKAVGIAAAAGGVGGAAGGALGSVVAPAVSRLGADAVPKAAQLSWRVAGVMAAGTAGGAAGGLAAGLTAGYLTTGKFETENLAEMVLMGFGGGLLGGVGAGFRSIRTGGASAVGNGRGPVTVPEGPGADGTPAPARQLVDAAGDGHAPRPRAIRAAVDEVFPNLAWTGKRTDVEAGAPRKLATDSGPAAGAATRFRQPDIAELRNPDVAELQNMADAEHRRMLADLGLGGEAPPNPKGYGGPPGSPVSPPNSWSPTSMSPWGTGTSGHGNTGRAPELAPPVRSAVGTSTSEPVRIAESRDAQHDSETRAGSDVDVAIARSTPVESPDIAQLRKPDVAELQHMADAEHRRMLADLGLGGGVSVHQKEVGGHPISPSSPSSWSPPSMSPWGTGSSGHGNTGQAPELAPPARSKVTTSTGDPARAAEKEVAQHDSEVRNDSDADVATAPSATVERPDVQINPPGDVPHRPGPDAFQQATSTAAPQRLPDTNSSVVRAAMPRPLHEASSAQDVAPLRGATAVAPAAAEASRSATESIGALSGRHGGDTDELQSDPEMVPDVLPPEAPTVVPAYVPDPTRLPVPELPMEKPEAYPSKTPQDYVIPGVPIAPDGPPPNGIPAVPRLPSSVPAELPATPPAYRPPVLIPGSDDTDDQDNRKTSPPPDIAPTPRHPAAPVTHLPATPVTGADESPSSVRYDVRPDPTAPGAPQDPTNNPLFDPNSLEYNRDNTGIPQVAGPPPSQLAQAPQRQVESARPVPTAQASADENGKGTGKKRRMPVQPEESTLEPKTLPPQPPSQYETNDQASVGIGHGPGKAQKPRASSQGRPESAASADARSAESRGDVDSSAVRPPRLGDDPVESGPTPWSGNQFSMTGAASETGAPGESQEDARFARPPARDDRRSGRPTPWAATFEPAEAAELGASPARTTTSPEYDVAAPNGPDSYRPQAVQGVRVRRPKLKKDGLFYGPDDELYNSSRKEYFLVGVDPADVRSINADEIGADAPRDMAPHEVLYSTYGDPDDGPIGFGVWLIRNGELRMLEFVTGTFSEDRMKFAAQLRDWLVEHRVNLAKVGVDGLVDGTIWRPWSPSVTSVEQLFTYPHMSADTLFNSCGVGFWVNVAAVESVPGRTSISYTINLLSGDPASFTLVFTEADGVTTARYTNIELGQHASRTALAQREVHTSLTAPLLAASGVGIADDDTTTESAAGPATETDKGPATAETPRARGGSATDDSPAGPVTQVYDFDIDRAARGLPPLRKNHRPLRTGTGLHGNEIGGTVNHHHTDDEDGRPYRNTDDPAQHNPTEPDIGDGSTAYGAPESTENSETEGNGEREPRARAASAQPQPPAETPTESSRSWFLNRIWTPIRLKTQPENKDIAGLNTSAFLTTAASFGLSAFIPVWVSDYSDSAQWTGIAMSAPAVMTLIAHLPAGYIADHVENRKTLLFTSATTIAVTGSAGGWLLAGLPGALEVVVGSVGVIAATRTISMTSHATYMRSLAKTEEQKKDAITLSMATTATAGTVGRSFIPALGDFSAAFPFLTDGVFNALNLKMLSKLPPAPPPEQRSRLLDGARATVRDSSLRLYTGLDFVWGLAGTSSIVQLAGLMNAANYSALEKGAVLGASSAGVVLAALAVPKKVVNERITLKWMYPTSAASLTALGVMYATTSEPWIIGPTSLLMGSAVMLTGKKLAEERQKRVPKEALGGALSTVGIVNGIGAAIGGWFGGLAISEFGAIPVAWMNAGGFGAMTAVAAGFAYATTRTERRTGPGPAGDGSTEYVAPDTAGRRPRLSGILRRIPGFRPQPKLAPELDASTTEVGALTTNEPSVSPIPADDDVAQVALAGESRLDWLRRTAVDGDEAVARVRNGVGWVHLWHDPTAGQADEIIDALRSYTGSASANSMLRAMGRQLTPQQRTELSLREVTAEEVFDASRSKGAKDTPRDRARASTSAAEINRMDWAFEHARASTGPVKLYRRVDSLEQVFGRDRDLADTELTDTGYMSTSAEPGRHVGSPIQIIIYADAGATLLCLSSLFDEGVPKSDAEREILIPRGSTLRILTEPRVENGVRTLEAELITESTPTVTSDSAAVSSPESGDRTATSGSQARPLRDDAPETRDNSEGSDHPKAPGTAGPSVGPANFAPGFDFRAALDLPAGKRPRQVVGGPGFAGLHPGAVVFHHDPTGNGPNRQSEHVAPQTDSVDPAPSTPQRGELAADALSGHLADAMSREARVLVGQDQAVRDITGPPTADHTPDSPGMQPSRTEYATVALPIAFDEDPMEVDLIRPAVGARGWFRGPDDEPHHTEHRLGEPFLLLANGEFVTAQHASHDDLPYTLALQDVLADQNMLDDQHGFVEVSGFGTWRISGRVKKIDAYWPGSVEANGNPMIPAQILAALLDRGADLSRCEFDEFGADHQGTLWREDATPPRIDEAIRQNGLDRILPGYGVTPQSTGNRVVFWVDLANVESSADGVLFTVIVNPVRSDPARVTVTVHQDGDTVTARYSHVDLGRDHMRAAAAVRMLHDRLTSWLVQSGASWAADSNTVPVENRRPDPIDSPDHIPPAAITPSHTAGPDTSAIPHDTDDAFEQTLTLLHRDADGDAPGGTAHPRPNPGPPGGPTGSGASAGRPPTEVSTRENAPLLIADELERMWREGETARWAGLGPATYRYGVRKLEMWLKTEGPLGPLDPHFGLNCWEMICYAAARVGLLAKPALRELLEPPRDPDDRAKGDWTAAVESRLIPGERNIYAQDSGDRRPQRGDIVSWSRKIEDEIEIASHVAMATGRTGSDGSPEVFSFWIPPKNDFVHDPKTGFSAVTDAVQITTIDRLSQAFVDLGWGRPYEIVFGRGPW